MARLSQLLMVLLMVMCMLFAGVAGSSRAMLAVSTESRMKAFIDLARVRALLVRAFCLEEATALHPITIEAKVTVRETLPGTRRTYVPVSGSNRCVENDRRQLHRAANAQRRRGDAAQALRDAAIRGADPLLTTTTHTPNNQTKPAPKQPGQVAAASVGAPGAFFSSSAGRAAMAKVRGNGAIHQAGRGR